MAQERVKRLQRELLDITNRIIAKKRKTGYRDLEDVIKQTEILKEINNLSKNP